MTDSRDGFVGRDWAANCASSICLAIIVASNSSLANDSLPDDARIAFTSVADALATLSARADTNLSTQDGWTVVVERDGAVVWSFVPKEHPAYPAVVKRVIVSRPDGVYVQMASLCESSVQQCDRLIQEFRDLNSQLGDPRP